VARLRPLLVACAGIVCATALIGVIGVFGAASSHNMTARALSAVPVDWQVALAPGADAAGLTDLLASSSPIRAARTVGLARVAGFSAVTGETTQSTGAGVALGLPPLYGATFPGQVRVLLGGARGVRVAQQTAANLHVTIGDKVTVTIDAARSIDAVVEGVVDLPNANALFQTIGPQQGPAAAAPPDNVVLLPMDQWMAAFGPIVQAGGESARLQIHVALDRSALPSAPDEAFIDAAGRAKNFEVRAAGAAQIGDNLSARLGAVRQDAIFARILLLFLGLPGVVLSVLLTVAIARADAGRRRREQALLSLRGASSEQIARLAFIDAALVASAGSVFGAALAAGLLAGALHVDLHQSGLWLWLAGAATLGFVMALVCVMTPALIDLRSASVASRRFFVRAGGRPLWEKIVADVGLILASGVIYWHSASTGYQVVLAPEGGAATSIDYTAFLAPLLFWIGSGLLVLRLCRRALANGRVWLGFLLAPLAGRMATPAAASLSRQSGRLAAGAALAALAFSFAAATAIFNTTYNDQALVDAQLTNGADVAVTGTTDNPAAARLNDIRSVPGVAAAEPMQHRFAYVGADLQDIYGVDPAQVGHATHIADAFFANHDARASLALLANTPDGVLVSQETANDFQLNPGDAINLRLQGAADHQYRVVPFHFIGIVNEFPTAPRDSFRVANAAYIATQTGSAAAEIVLVRALSEPAALASAIREKIGPNAAMKTTDVSQAAHLIGSSLTAVDLSGLSRIELGFAVLLCAMATGLMVWLGQTERSRANAVLLALGASRSQMRSFLWSEAIVILAPGLLFGAIGTTSALILVRLLNGVFDPPPETLSVPWGYLGLVGAGALTATLAAVYAQASWSKEWAVRSLRRLRPSKPPGSAHPNSGPRDCATQPRACSGRDLDVSAKRLADRGIWS
jgi:putative ABC transport system permease protein